MAGAVRLAIAPLRALEARDPRRVVDPARPSFSRDFKSLAQTAGLGDSRIATHVSNRGFATVRIGP
ncbi:MAG TPA: hypothetical protein VED63_04595, partial [Acidimicrobiales bacterium]|nr:hypothetical protein [Acidimicrobiales bacterium]